MSKKKFMIKAILFDAGGVVVDMHPLIDKIVSIFKPEDKHEFWNELNERCLPLCRGEITEMQYWKNIMRELGIALPTTKVKDLWTEDFTNLTSIDHGVMNIIHSLKPKYRLGLVSNTIPAHVRIMRRRGMLKHFDAVILSCEVKMAKGDPDMFLLAAKQLDVKPEECIFIDDVPAFLATAQSIGMKAILFKNAKQLKTDLLQAGINLGNSV
jgi:epoxide hydrolase-like predicted phosphatase